LRKIENKNKEAYRCTKDNYESWKNFADRAVAGGGRFAHRYAKGPRAPPEDLLLQVEDGAPLPVQGDAAIEVLLSEWLPRWQVPRKLATCPANFDVKGQTMPPITLEGLRRVLRSYTEAVVCQYIH
jgi:hypothetical protein